jgi:hypothetical protein
MREVEQEIASRWTDAVLLLHHCRTGHSTTRGLWAVAANSVPHSSVSPHCIVRSGLSDEWGTLLATPAQRSQLSVTQTSTQESSVFRRVRIIGGGGGTYHFHVRLSACTCAAPAERISLISDIGDFFEKLLGYFYLKT